MERWLASLRVSSIKTRIKTAMNNFSVTGYTLRVSSIKTRIKTLSCPILIAIFLSESIFH